MRVCFSRDDQRLFTAGGADKTVMQWRVVRGAGDGGRYVWSDARARIVTENSVFIRIAQRVENQPNYKPRVFPHRSNFTPSLFDPSEIYPSSAAGGSAAFEI
jgi:hypothetical protein